MTGNEGMALVNPGRLIEVPKKFKRAASALTASIFHNTSLEILPASFTPSLTSRAKTPQGASEAQTQLVIAAANENTEAAPSLSDIQYGQPTIVFSSERQHQQENSSFRNPTELPSVSPKIFVYPHSGSEISNAFQGRFREVVNLFRMCGSSVDEAHPSILVFCRPSEFSCLRSLLNSKHLKMQYCLRKSSPKYSWKEWGKSTSDQPSDITYKPLFNLYFWRAPRPRNLYNLEHVYRMDSVSVLIDSGGKLSPPLTMSGTTITLPDEQGGCSTSTIGCVLQVNSKFYGLTAAHVLRKADESSLPNAKIQSSHGVIRWMDGPECAFREQDSNSVAAESWAGSAGGQPSAASALQTSVPDYKLDQALDDDDFVDDVEYGNLAESDEETWQDHDVFESRPMLPDREQAHSIAVLPPNSCSPSCEHCKIPDNDWALVALTGIENHLPNAFLNINHLSQPTFFSPTPGRLPKEECAVLIIASNQRVLRGLLQSVPCFLGGITRNDQAEYWTVILAKGEQLSRGDSGSIVVAADTPATVYGHVVASNPLGEVYISPLTATISQVMGLLSTTHVALPEPLPLLTGLASYHLLKGHDYGFELLNYLDSLIQSTQQTSDWSPLESWALCHQRDELLESVKKSLQVVQDPEKIRILQKFSPDHSEKVLGQEIIMSVDVDSTYLSTALQDGTSVALTEITDDSDYEFSDIVSQHLEAVNELERKTCTKIWSGSRNSSDGDDSDTDTLRNIRNHQFNDRQNIQGIAIEDQPPRNDRVVDKSHSKEASSQTGFSNHGPLAGENEDNLESSSGASKYGIKHERLSSHQQQVSLEEDYFYYRILKARRNQEPSYESTMKGGRVTAMINETLPNYSCSVHLEGIFLRKMELENATKRAADRRWQMVYVVLHGTALEIYNTKKTSKWRDYTGEVNPDKPPWIKQGNLKHSYSLQYAESGIAADYKKRRYVIRVRAETDQFLLSCVEIETFSEWLGELTAATNIALPIDDWDFPQDQSIPRIHRLGWFEAPLPTPTGLDSTATIGLWPGVTSGSEKDENSSNDGHIMIPSEFDAEDGPSTRQGLSIHQGPSTDQVRVEVLPSMSSPLYLSVDPETGKWFPEHGWSNAHDCLYARLCYSNLLFGSPRKSNLIVSKGKQWYVDWLTNRMVRVLPPAYGEIEHFGPWEVVHTENRRI